MLDWMQGEVSTREKGAAKPKNVKTFTRGAETGAVLTITIQDQVGILHLGNLLITHCNNQML